MGRLKALRSAITNINQFTAKPLPTTGDKQLYGTRDWFRLMATIKRERGMRCQDPRCVSPEAKGRKLYGDHVIELKDGGAPLDPANIMLRCASCHTRKTNDERYKRITAKVSNPRVG